MFGIPGATNPGQICAAADWPFSKRQPAHRLVAVRDKLLVNEIYLSIQGESTFAGLPCVFVRLTGCPLRCSYCDTAYAFSQGELISIEDLRSSVLELAAPFGREGLRRLPLVELTGGEPLAQSACLGLMSWLCEEGFSVLLETSGAIDISPVDPRVHRIMDLKCPGSGEESRNLWDNLRHLNAGDEVKFVIGTAEDYAWAKGVLQDHRLASICTVLFSHASPITQNQASSTLKKAPEGQTPLSRLELAELVIADALPVRFQVQMHKVIWAPDARGV
jgi:7-carboxy-7-deazaguanine synthase